MRDGNVVLKMRKGSSYWQAHLKMRGEWLRLSTGKSDIREAAQWACEQYDDMMYRVRHNQVPRTKLVRDATAQYIKDLETSSLASAAEYRRTIKKWIDPFLGGKKLDELSPHDITAWNAWKREQHGKPFTKSTVTSHNSCLSNVFKSAVRYGWMSDWQIPKLPNEGELGCRRPHFDEDEISALLIRMWQLIPEGRKERTREIRQLIYYYVTVLLLTGARPGKELNNLRWRQVDLDWEHGGQKFVKLTITAGKTIKYSRVRQRVITAPASVAATPFKALMAWQGPDKTLDDFVFRLPDGSTPGNMANSFQVILTKIGMLWDRGDPPARRSLYSLRHSYATTQIVHGTMSLIELATHMGTSVAMLEQHYAHLGPLAIAPKVAANAMLISPHVTAGIFNDGKPHDTSKKQQKPDTHKPSPTIPRSLADALAEAEDE
jgi:integrase